jgi:hypothetical protein
MNRIKSVGVLSCAKMLGVLYGCMGLLFIPFALIAGLAGMATQQARGSNLAAGAISGAVLMVFGILAPFLYGTMGFVFGAIGAWIYNLIAKRLGGIEIQLEAAPVTSF